MGQGRALAAVAPPMAAAAVVDERERTQHGDNRRWRRGGMEPLRRGPHRTQSPRSEPLLSLANAAITGAALCCDCFRARRS